MPHGDWDGQEKFAWAKLQNAETVRLRGALEAVRERDKPWKDRDWNNGPARTPGYEWTLAEAPCLNDEDESEYNPGGFWLGNQETNQVFILPEDLDKVRALLAAAPSVPVVGLHGEET